MQSSISDGGASCVSPNFDQPEAKHLFVLMKRRYRISRNVRAQWYFHHLNQPVQLENENDIDKDDCDLAIIGALPEGLTNYKMTPSTRVTFISRMYRMVFVLDYSPSTAIADSDLNCVLQNNIFASFRNFLIGLLQPVLLQGCEVNINNLWSVLREVECNSDRFIRGVAEASAFALDTLEKQRKFRSFIEAEASATSVPANQKTANAASSYYSTPMQVPSDSILIDMVRFGMLAVQLLPENTSAGMVFFTDGVLGVPDVSILETLLVQLRIWTIGCTFVLVQSKICNPDCAFGKVSNTEFMRFLSSATFGAYLESCPNVGPSPDKAINLYHKAILCWGFQRALDQSRHDSGNKGENPLLIFHPMRHKHYNCVLATSLTSILSIRLREGYTIKNCVISNDQIRVDLILPWKFHVNMEYVVISDWPASKQNAKVQIEFWTESAYEFLNDILSPKQSFRSPYRASVVATFFNSVQSLTQADKILMTFESFRLNSVYYTIPDPLKIGLPLFYVSAESNEPVLSSRDLETKYQTFCNFWRPVCTLDMNVWQKWLHTHRITLLLTHDVPLSSHLHTPSTHTGRYGSITCRQAAAAVDNALKAWSTFTLLDSHSYIKFEHEATNVNVPEFFYIIRPSFKPPCVVVRLAFLGGIKGSVRHKIVTSLTERLLTIKINQRDLHNSFLTTSDFSSRRTGQSLRTDMVKVKACRHTKKPVEKILVRYEKIPKNLSFMIQEEDLNKTTALNNVLCRYLHCKRWIWSLKRSSYGSQISTDSAAIILNTLLRKRLNNKFRFAFGNDGVITLIKEYAVTTESFNSSCIVQYVLYPPISTPVTNAYRPMSTKATRESICSENEPSEAESVESSRDIQLVTELWVEPQYGKLIHQDETFYCEDLFSNVMRFYYDDVKIVKSLATFEHLKLLKEGGERKFIAKQSASLFGRNESDAVKLFLSQKDSLEIDFNPEIDQSVITIGSCFDICELLENCQMATLSFSSLICVEDPLNKEDLPNVLFVEALHHELKHFHDSSWLLHRDRDLYKFWTMVIGRLTNRHLRIPNWLTNLKKRSNDTFEGQKHRLPQVVCYVRRISETRLSVSVCPRSLEDIHLLWTVGECNQAEEVSSSGRLENNITNAKFEKEPDGSVSFPLLIFNCYESFVRNSVCGDECCRWKNEEFNFVRDYRNCVDKNESVLSTFHRQISMATESGGADADLEKADFNFPLYCSYVETLYCRAFVTAVYRALVSDCSVHPTDIKLSVEGKCEETNIEIDISEFMEVVCDHFKEYLNEYAIPNLRRDTIETDVSTFSLKSSCDNEALPCFRTPACCKAAHNFIRNSFSTILNRQFKSIKSCPEFYFYCPPLRFEEPVSEADSFGTASHEDFHTMDETVAFDSFGETMDTFALTDVSTIVSAKSRTRLSLTTSTLTRETLRSLPDVSSCSSTDGSNEHVTSAWRYPMFLHLACSVQLGSDLRTCAVQDFPTCLAEILRNTDFDQWDENLRFLQITYDMLILTIGPEEDVSSFDNCSTPNSTKSDENLSLSSPCFAGEDSFQFQVRQLVDIPETQRNMLEALKAEINLLIRNEIFFAYGQTSQIVNSSILKRIFDHVNEICENNKSNIPNSNDFEDSGRGDRATPFYAKPDAYVEYLPLTFVLNETESLNEFRNELIDLTSTYFNLVKSDRNYFYARLDRQRYKGDLRKLSHSAERPVGELSTSEFVDMNPDASTLPVFRLDDDSSSSNPNINAESVRMTSSKAALRNIAQSRFVQMSSMSRRRSQSFSGFSSFYVSERDQMLKGKWSSVSDVLTFDGRLLKRLQLRSGSGPSHERYWSGASTITSNMVAVGGGRRDTLTKENTTETGYDAESSEPTCQDDQIETFENRALSVKYMEDCCVHDFWLIICIYDTALSIAFLERLAGTHKNEFNSLVSEIKNLLKKVNQKMLLNNLFETNRCNSLLAENGSKFDSVGNVVHPPDEDDLYDTEQPTYLAASTKFAPGYFACPCVHYRWFPIHSRLKTGASRVGTNRAMQALKSLLNKFSVINRENMFVFKESSTGTVFYIRLHDKAQSASLAFAQSVLDNLNTNSKAKVKFQDSTKTEVSNLVGLPSSGTDSAGRKISTTKFFAKELMTKVLITVHGISEPGDEIKEQLMNALEHKLNDAVLEQLLLTLERNPNCKLMSEDIEFLQPVSKNPQEVWCYVLPSIAIVHLYPVSFYLRQHLLEFLHLPNYVSNNQQFRAYGVEDGAVFEDDGQVYLYCPKTPGSKGIAVVSQTFADTYGNVVPLVHFDTLEPMDGFGNFFQSGRTFDSLTNVPECPPPTSSGRNFADGDFGAEIPKRKTAPASVLVQFAVWPVGDVLPKQLNVMLKNALLAALCDLVTEFGLLTASVLESNSSFLDGIAISEPGSPVDKGNNESNLQSMRKRHSSAAMNMSKTSVFSFENFQQFVKKADSGDSNRRRHNSSQPKVGQVADSAALSATSRKPSDVRMNQIFATLAPTWFDYVAEHHKNSSLQRFTFQLDARFSRSAVLKEIYDSFKRYLEKDSDILCFNETSPQFGGRQFESFMPFRLPLLADDGNATSLDDPLFGAKDDSSTTDRSTIIVCQPLDLWKDSMQFGRATSYGNVPESLTAFTNPSYRILQRFLPLYANCSISKGFIPRQRVILVLLQGCQVTMYCYNWIGEVVTVFSRIITKLICWHNARAHLLKRICLQKMGFFHNVEIPESVLKTNPYMTSHLIDSENFVTNMLPPNQMPTISATRSSLSDCYSNLHTIYKNVNGSPLWAELKPINLDSNLDPVTVHGHQMTQVRSILKKQTEEENQFEQIFRIWQNCKNENRVPAVDVSSFKHPLNFMNSIEDQQEQNLKQLIGRSRLIHVVYTPFLFHPGWREKVGQIRQPSSYAANYRPASPQRSRHSSGQSQSHKQSANSGPVSPLIQSKSSGLFGSGAESWHMQLQSLMCQQYTQYLQSLGLVLLQKKQKRSSTAEHLFDPLALSEISEIWFQKIFTSGILLIRSFFEEPYFAVQFYFLHSFEFRRQIKDDADDDKNWNDLLYYCNNFASMSHLHSFSYDFHLRMVAAYAAGDRQITFRHGYNMHAFLNDFLRYYTCRPPYARTYVFEDHLIVSGLEIRNEQLYNYILDHDKTYGLRVVRMRIPSAGNNEELTSEYLLTSHDSFVLTFGDRRDVNYQILHILMRDDCDDLGLFNNYSSQTSGVGRKFIAGRDILSLKFYVIFVDQENMFPFATTSDQVDAGKYERVRTPSWVIGERLSGDGAVQSRPLIMHALRSSTPETTITGMASSYRPPGGVAYYSPTKTKDPRRQSTVMGFGGAEGPVRSRTLSGDTTTVNRQIAALARFEVSRVSEGDSPFLPETSSDVSWKTATMDMLSTSSMDDAKSDSPNGRINIATTRVPPTNRPIEGSSLQAEAVTYLTFVTDFESITQQQLAGKTAEFKVRLKGVVREAASHCHRDQLWRKLLTGVCSSEVLLRKRDENAGITYSEFQTLLHLAHLMPIEQVDPNLTFCSKLSRGSSSSLIRALVIKYGDHCRKFVNSNDSQCDCLVILNPNYLDTFIMVSLDQSKKDGHAVVQMVYKDFSAVETDAESRIESVRYRHMTIKKFWEEFVNVLVYNVWCRLLI